MERCVRLESGRIPHGINLALGFLFVGSLVGSLVGWRGMCHGLHMEVIGECGSRVSPTV